MQSIGGKELEKISHNPRFSPRMSPSGTPTDKSKLVAHTNDHASAASFAQSGVPSVAMLPGDETKHFRMQQLQASTSSTCSANPASRKRQRTESTSMPFDFAENGSPSMEPQQQDEAGLSLLIEASLLQQRPGREVDDDRTAVPTCLQAGEDPSPVDTARALEGATERAVGVVKEAEEQPPLMSNKPFNGGQVISSMEREASVNNERASTPAAPPTLSHKEERATDLATTAQPLQAQKEPSPFSLTDVLCGRGGFINKHPGNIIYRKVVEYNKATYKQVPKRDRILVSQSIVQTILNRGGRFLISEGGSKQNSWKEVDFRKAVQKTSQALRERSVEAEEEEEKDDIMNSNDDHDDAIDKEEKKSDSDGENDIKPPAVARTSPAHIDRETTGIV
jgi:hypothetical protein